MRNNRLLRAFFNTTLNCKKSWHGSFFDLIFAVLLKNSEAATPTYHGLPAGGHGLYGYHGA
jgi:hypothetical protein